MTGAGNNAAPGVSRRASQDPAWVRWLLITLAVSSIGVLIIIPVIAVFAEAFANGAGAYFESLYSEPYTRHAIGLTLIVAPIAVACNLAFGMAAAWAITRFEFPGRAFLTTLIDLPFAVSPVVAGLMFMLLFSPNRGLLGPFLAEYGVKLAFSWIGIAIVTTFVTLPFIARELIPVMDAIGSDEEVAAVSLGANRWHIFWRVTLPNIKWGLLYGLILCNARAMGEFGAARVVSGNIYGSTATMPLRVEQLFQDQETAASFAVASLLTMLALITLVIKVWLERQTRMALAEAARDQQPTEE
jgi:sulfate transport system permease protein